VAQHEREHDVRVAVVLRVLYMWATSVRRARCERGGRTWSRSAYSLSSAASSKTLICVGEMCAISSSRCSNYVVSQYGYPGGLRERLTSGSRSAIIDALSASGSNLDVSALAARRSAASESSPAWMTACCAFSCEKSSFWFKNGNTRCSMMHVSTAVLKYDRLWMHTFRVVVVVDRRRPGLAVAEEVVEIVAWRVIQVRHNVLGAQLEQSMHLDHVVLQLLVWGHRRDADKLGGGHGWKGVGRDLTIYS
jgi:hypothetical protein